jgi:RNA polymerase sigma factor (sigma-70 family)
VHATASPSPSNGAQLPDPAELERLLERAADGDELAWATLVRRFTPRVRAVARAHRLSPHDADDVMQATWLQLLRSIGKVREPQFVGGYIHTTASNLSVRRAAAGCRQRPLDDEALERLAPAEPEDPEQELFAAGRTEALWRALGRLPHPQRELMQMLMQEPPPSYAEISERLDIPVGSIGPTRARCVERLRQDTELRSWA